MRNPWSSLWLALLGSLAVLAGPDDPRLTPAERTAWKQLEQRMLAATPSHALWLTNGLGLLGWFKGETNGLVHWEAPFGADSRWLMQFERGALSHAQVVEQKPPPLNYCDVSFQLEFPELRLIRRPPYALLTDEPALSAERYLGLLQELHTNFVAHFGALTGGLGLPDHVQVLLFTDEDAFCAYRKKVASRRNDSMGFYQITQQRLTVFDQRYTAGMDEILSRLAWQGEKAEVQARTEEAAAQQRLFFLFQACSAMRLAEAGNQRILRHEGAHQLLHASGILAEGATPGWLAEGLAQWYETRVPGAVSFELTGRLKASLEAGRLLPLAELMNYQPRKNRGFYEGERKQELAYAEAWGLVRLLMRPARQEKFFNYLKHLRRLEAAADIRRTPPLDLLCRFLALTPADLETLWKTSIERLPFEVD